MFDYTVADYLLDRLAQIGIKHLYGVPGDYNLLFLDRVIAHPDITWVGCANELNAAYAADGYARCGTPAAVLTTYGVGELSAINGIAGSYAEYLPVIHIVGSPSIAVQHSGERVHHTLGDGDFGHFSRMYREVTVAQATLTAANAAAEIDWVLAQCLAQHRPVYLNLPSDIALAACHKAMAPLPLPVPPCNEASLCAFTLAVRQALSTAQRVSLLADFLVERFAASDSVRELAHSGYLPHATLMMGKGMLDETHQDFLGIYAGNASQPGVKEGIEEADWIIMAGVMLTDTLTCGFSHDLPQHKRIELLPFEARVGKQVFSQVPMVKAVDALIQVVQELGSKWCKPAPQIPDSASEAVNPTQHVTQSLFWQSMQSFIQPQDIVLAEQGTACFGAIELRLPKAVKFIAQPLWGAIGFTLPATLGVQQAQPNRRVILIIGDGSAQITIQELGTLLREGLSPIVIVLNNEGYTIERAIHGPTQRYNDIAAWDWGMLPYALDLERRAAIYQITTVSELQSVLSSLNDGQGRGSLTLLEVKLPMQDIPPFLTALTERLKHRNGEQ